MSMDEIMSRYQILQCHRKVTKMSFKGAPFKPPKKTLNLIKTNPSSFQISFPSN